MITWEVHSMSEMPKDLQKQFPDYEKLPFVMQTSKGLDNTHYVIYTDNPFIRINPLKFAIYRRYPHLQAKGI